MAEDMAAPHALGNAEVPAAVEDAGKSDPAAPVDVPPPSSDDKPAQDTAPETDEAVGSKPNGTNENPAHSDEYSELPAPTQETGTMESTENTAADAGGTVATPTSNKKAVNGSSKKKSAAVPEHKSKKLNKKKSKANLHLDAVPGELFLARMKGHQPWPSVICDEEMLPNILINSRPVTTALPDGSFKKPEYADGGKRANERTFPIMFLYTNEFAWIPNTDLTPVIPDECKNVTDKGKSKSLLEAYAIAAEGHSLNYFKNMLAEHQEAMVEDAERRAEREAKKAQKAKRKSDAAAAADTSDDMDVDEEEEEGKPKPKKRKKSIGSDGAEEKAAKTPRIKLSNPKTPATESSSKKRAAKPKPTTKKTAAKVLGSDDEMLDTPIAQEKPLTPAEAMEKKEKEIRYYRHKLQKGFLSRDTAPTDDEIKSMSGFLSKLETYPDLEGSIIRATKIHKVLKAMLRLASIPKDEDFSFKKRSLDLLSKWNKILADDPSASREKDDEKDDKPETNGVGKPTEEDDAAKADTFEETLAVKEDKDEIMADTPAAEADKPAESAETKTLQPSVEDAKQSSEDPAAGAISEAVEATA